MASRRLFLIAGMPGAATTALLLAVSDAETIGPRSDPVLVVPRPRLASTAAPGRAPRVDPVADMNALVLDGLAHLSFVALINARCPHVVTPQPVSLPWGRASPLLSKPPAFI